jgi:hypothetical protein
MTIILETNPHNYATAEVQTQHNLELLDKRRKEEIS